MSGSDTAVATILLATVIKKDDVYFVGPECITGEALAHRVARRIVAALKPTC